MKSRLNHIKQCVCGFLSSSGEDEQLVPLSRATQKQQESLLRWMDDGAIALYFWDKIQRRSLSSHIPAALAFELARRAHDNRARSSHMLSELQSVNQALAATGAPYAILKGFSLSPHFSSLPELRHQIDIDILIAPESGEAFSAAMHGCGYLLESTTASELKFTTAAHKIASRGDYAYDLPASRQLELHRFFWEPLHNIDLNISSTAALQAVEMYQIADVAFPVLSLEWRLLLQLLHAYRHFASLWLRVGWLYELACFLEKHGADETLSTAFLGLVERFSVEKECGFILRLVAMTFKVRLPLPLERLADRVPRRAGQWLQCFGLEWALTGFPGSKLPLMVLADLSPSRNSAFYHGLRRMLPTQLGTAPAVAPGNGSRAELLRARLLHIARRSRFHIFATAQYLLGTVRWRMLLASQPQKTTI